MAWPSTDQAVLAEEGRRAAPSLSYIGGWIDASRVQTFLRRLRDGGRAPAVQWVGQCGGGSQFVRVLGRRWRCCETEQALLILRGPAVSRALGSKVLGEEIARQIVAAFDARGQLPLHDLDGSFTLVLLERRRGRVLLYRNLVGCGNTFYTVTSAGFMFSSNLAELVSALDSTPGANRDVLPLYFLFRSVPGRQTLFEGIYRLMPGELVTFDREGLRRRQVQTFASIGQPAVGGRNAVDRLDELMAQITSDYAAWYPGAGVLLSGGVDSTYLQAHWKHAGPANALPKSFAVCVDHPMTQLDTDYARSAAEVLGTEHREVRVNGRYASHLLETIGATGEMPNHVQTAYLPALARAMVGAGVRTGVCGEAADGFFGFSAANFLQNARVLRGLLPSAWLRSRAAWVARRLNLDRAHYYLSLANYLNDFTYLEHPVNQTEAFTHWPSVFQCFGRARVAEALAYRRQLVQDYQVDPHPLPQLHAASSLASGIDSAAFWTTLFNLQGAELLCPYLDSRVLRFVAELEPRERFPFRRPKQLLKRAVARHVPRHIAFRKKRGFGQPIFEWLAEGGQLRPLVDSLGSYDFVDQEVLQEARRRPNWFLYSLVCYDVWHKIFIECRRVDPNVAKKAGERRA